MADDANLPIIPDKVMDKVRAGKPVALEEISAAAADMQGASADARRQPVHAGDLTAISKGQAREMFGRGPDGVLPRMPSTRRVIPEPFQRQHVSIDRHGKKWQTVKASTVEPGDMVQGHGRVAERADRIRYSTRAAVLGAEVRVGEPARGADGELVDRPHEKIATGTDAILINISGDALYLDSQTEVRVFRKAPQEKSPE